MPKTKFLTKKNTPEYGPGRPPKPKRRVPDALGGRLRALGARLPLGTNPKGPTFSGPGGPSEDKAQQGTKKNNQLAQVTKGSRSGLKLGVEAAGESQSMCNQIKRYDH